MLRSKRGRILGEFSETMPRVKTRGELFAMERGAQQVSLEREVLPKLDRKARVRPGSRKPRMRRSRSRVG